MANNSIKDAFQRMWDHIIIKLNTKADQSDVAALRELVGDTSVSEQINAAIANNSLSRQSARIAEINLLANNWVGTKSPYSQVVSIDGVTEYSQVDLTPSIEQLVIFYEKDLGFVTENEDGVVTVYAIGQKPENNYTIQVTITEVYV